MDNYLSVNINNSESIENIIDEVNYDEKNDEKKEDDEIKEGNVEINFNNLIDSLNDTLTTHQKGSLRLRNMIDKIHNYPQMIKFFTIIFWILIASFIAAFLIFNVESTDKFKHAIGANLWILLSFNCTIPSRRNTPWCKICVIPIAIFAFTFNLILILQFTIPVQKFVMSFLFIITTYPLTVPFLSWILVRSNCYRILNFWNGLFVNDKTIIRREFEFLQYLVTHGGINLSPRLTERILLVIVNTNNSNHGYDRLLFENYLNSIAVENDVNSYDNLERLEEGTLNEDNEDNCMICLEDYMDNNDGNNIIVTLQCNHIFHKTCISEWGAINKTCPICRVNMMPEINISNDA